MICQSCLILLKAPLGATDDAVGTDSVSHCRRLCHSQALLWTTPMMVMSAIALWRSGALRSRGVYLRRTAYEL